MTKPPGLTIDEIAKAQKMTRSRIYQLSETRDFPVHEYMIGRNKIYDPKKVARYFANRTDRRLATA